MEGAGESLGHFRSIPHYLMYEIFEVLELCRGQAGTNESPASHLSPWGAPSGLSTAAPQKVDSHHHPLPEMWNS